MTEVYVIGKNRTRQIEPESITFTYSVSVRLPVPKRIGWADKKKVPPDVLLILEAQRKEEHELVVSAQEMSTKHPDEFTFVKEQIEQGKPERAELLLRVSSKYPNELESAVLALDPAMGADDEKVRELNLKLRQGESLVITRELDDLMPLPEKSKQKPKPKVIPRVVPVPVIVLPIPPKRTVGTSVAGETPREPQAAGSLQEATFADDSRIEESIKRNFPKRWGRADKAYQEFRKAGGRLTQGQVGNVFYILGRLTEIHGNPEWNLQYFEHMLSDPENVGQMIGIFTDNERLDRANKLMDKVLMSHKLKREVILSKVPEQVDATFETIFLSKPEGYRFLTGENAGDVNKVIDAVSTNIINNRVFLAQMIEHTDYREVALDTERLGRGKHVLEDMHKLAEDIGVQLPDKPITFLFGNIFTRPAETFKLTTSEVALKMASQLSSKDKLSAILEPESKFTEQYARVLLNRPEVLTNIGEDPDAIPDFVKGLSELRDLPDYEGYVNGYFERMVGDERFAVRFSEPEVLRGALQLVDEWRDYVKPADILSYEFLYMGEDEQMRELNRVKRLVDNPNLTERVWHGERGPNEDVETDDEAGAEPKIGDTLTTSVHGIRVPKDLDYQEEDPRFPVLNTQYIRKIELERINRLPPHHKRIINLLSNLSSPEEDFQIGQEQLIKILRSHSKLGRVYREQDGANRLDVDLKALSSAGIVEYSLRGGAVKLSDTVLKTGKTAELTDAIEEKLVAILDETTYRKREDFDADRLVILALAGSEDHVAHRRDIVEKIYIDSNEQIPRERISSRISYLDKNRGLIRKTDPTGKDILLSPHVIFEIDDMNLPDIYRKRYIDAIDPLRRIRRMYHASISDDRPPNRYFSPALSEPQAAGIYGAVSAISSEGDERRAIRISDVIERRQHAVMTLTNLNWNMEHGAKRERLIEDAKDMSLSTGAIQNLLSDMVGAGVLERVALGYYRINQKYWAKEQPDFAEMEYPKHPSSKRMHKNVDKSRIRTDLGECDRFKTGYRMDRAMTLATIASNEHTTIPYCARAQDILELRRTLGEEVTEDQNQADLEALTTGVESQEKVIRGPLDTLKELTGQAAIPHLIERFRPQGTSEVFWKITGSYVGGRSQE